MYKNIIFLPYKYIKFKIMIGYIKRYPLSIITVAIIIYLSFFRPPQTPLNEIKNIDKLVHLCMYGGLTLVLWIEHLLQHKYFIKKHLIIGGVICPIVMSGLIEIGQSTLTSNRSGDWFDLLANISGVILGSMFSYYIIYPYINKRKKRDQR